MLVCFLSKCPLIGILPLCHCPKIVLCIWRDIKSTSFAQSTNAFLTWALFLLFIKRVLVFYCPTVFKVHCFCCFTDQVIPCCMDLVESAENSRVQTLAASALWALAYNNHKVSPLLLWESLGTVGGRPGMLDVTLPVSNIRAVIWFPFPISSLIFLPNPVVFLPNPVAFLPNPHPVLSFFYCFCSFLFHIFL